MAASKMDAEIDTLYQLPLDDFTAARNALAKQAGSAGSDIRALQKPPIPAWAVNQVYWRNRPTYEALIDAATALRTAHASVLSGRKADLRSVGKNHEEALESALKSALDILQESGHPATDATRQAIATTLRGLPAEEPPGRLARTLQPGGFEMLSGIPVRAAPAANGRIEKAARGSPPASATSKREPKPPKLTAAETQAIARARDALTTAGRALKAAEHAARREEFEAARAGRDAEKAAREVQSTREQLESAQQAFEDAESQAAAAVKRSDAARRRADEAESALSAAQDSIHDAEREIERISQGKS
jgi:hypothetical protein